MDEALRAKVERLRKSASNVSRATNDAQKDAAQKFLIQRADELREDQERLADWLHTADAYIEANMPEINGDESNEYNQEWLESLQDYQVVSDVLNSAWNTYMSALEAA